MQHDFLIDEIPINSILPDEEDQYLYALENQGLTKLKKIFTEDSAYLQNDCKDAKKPCIKVKPSYDAHAEKVFTQFTSKIPSMRKPLRKSLIVEKTFTADSERKFHFSFTNKWSDKLISVNPDNL